ncbi:hypothetical protein D3C75_1368640 [compost metagenome]
MPTGIFTALQDTENHQYAKADKDNYRAHLDQREPVFRFTEAFDRDVVKQEHQAKEQGAPDPARRVWEPVVHHQL